MANIDPKYLYGFTEEEKLKFEQEEQEFAKKLAEYRDFCKDVSTSKNPAILFSDGDSYSQLKVKYLINRLALNDPTLKYIRFASKDQIYGDIAAKKIAQAIKSNTYCKSFTFLNRQFTDTGVIAIIDSLKDKENIELTLTDTLNENTYRYIYSVISDPTNRWKSISLGEINLSDDIKNLFDKEKRIICAVKDNTRITYPMMTGKHQPIFPTNIIKFFTQIRKGNIF